MPTKQGGVGMYVYVANRSMEVQLFYNADGELQIVPPLPKYKLKRGVL